MATDDKVKDSNRLANGTFAKGNTVPKRDPIPAAIKKMFRTRRAFAMQLWEGFQYKTEDEIRDILKAPEIPIGNKIFGEFFLRLKKQAQLGDLQIYFGMSGLKPEYIESIFGPEEGDDTSTQVPLTKEEKLLLLEKLKSKVSDDSER